jgi:hypothetical protein
MNECNKRMHTSSKPASSIAGSEDANAQLYQALMRHKQQEQQRVKRILHDTQSTSEAMIQKQRDAQQSRLVVSAVGEQYVNNARYVQINSGLEPRIKVFSDMHALSPDECDVYSNLVDKCSSGKVTVMHNHCMSEQGMIEGFRFTVSSKERSSCLPVCRKMFFRHSMVECLLPKGHETTILQLLLKQGEVRAKLVNLMQKLYSESIGHEADFDCMPENVDSLDLQSSASELMGGTRSTPLLSCYSSRRTADCRLVMLFSFCVFVTMPNILGNVSQCLTFQAMCHNV